MPIALLVVRRPGARLAWGLSARRSISSGTGAKNPEDAVLDDGPLPGEARGDDRLAVKIA
jgi:hypothetical protein